MIMGFTKPIEHFNLQRKKVITMNTLYVGIDVSSKSNVVYLMLPNGDKHSNFSVANSHEGSTQLVKRILSALTSHSLDTVLIGLEATSVYGDNLVYFLREDATLAPFNRKIHVLNPKQVKKFHDAYNDLPKNDYVDSFVIADCLRFARINKEVYMGDYRYTGTLLRCSKFGKRKAAIYECAVQEVFYDDAGEGLQRYLQHYRPCCLR